jgi:hypothetical protein
VFPGLEGVYLAGAGLARGHPQDSRLGVGVDRHTPGDVGPASGRLQGWGNGCALGVIGFLVAAHVRLVACPLLSPVRQVTAQPAVPKSVHKPSVKMDNPGGEVPPLSAWQFPRH